VNDDLKALIERWAAVLPAHLRQDFRADFARIARDHERTLETIQRIWQQRDQRQALDESTGLARRRPFLDHLASLLTPGTSAGAVAVLFLDVDHLKRLNDTFGHDAGDRALAAVGRIIRDAIRAERQLDFSARAPADTDDYSVSRHGGDEFLIALELDRGSTIDVIAPRIKQHVDDPARQLAHGYRAPTPLSVSMGGVVYELPDPAPPVAPRALARALIDAADAQMYEAKRDGRIHVVPARWTDRLDVDRERARALPAP